jgi:transcriptional regulator GlxA family with amidase domain
LTTRQLVLRARVSAAARLVVASDRRLADIACAIGFVDQAHMTRAFRATVGVTPGALRRSLRCAPT